MRKLLILGLAVALNSCGQYLAPEVPDAKASADAVARPGSQTTTDTVYGSVMSGGKFPTMGTEKSTRVVDRRVVKSNDSQLPAVPTNTPTEVRVARTVSLNLDTKRGVWEGWGTNLGAWANGVGGSTSEELYADLLFTAKDVKFLSDTTLPGLALNIVRYQVGGAGRPEDTLAGIEATDTAPSSDTAHDGMEPYQRLEGFWKDNASTDPSSASFDWTRDSNQRSLMGLAKARGVDNFELYSAAPMWWMTEEKSAAGGQLLAAQRDNAMLHLALVTQYARVHWGFKITSIEPFQEASAPRAAFPLFEQALNLDLEVQGEALAFLKVHVKHLNMGEVKLTAADERNPTEALANHRFMEGHTGSVESVEMKISDLYEKINVHTSDKGEPFRDNKERSNLREAAAAKRLWVSGYNDKDSSGLTLAQSIFSDLNYLQPSAWVYAQAVEPYGDKGLVTGNFHMMPADNAVRGKPLSAATKYFVMAQFTRFIRPGQTILGNNDDRSLIAYDAASKKLTFVILNEARATELIDLDLSLAKSWKESATVVTTRMDGSQLFKSKLVKSDKKKLSFTAEPFSVTSIELSDVVLP